MMIFLLSIFSIIFKWYRLLYILISFEFMLMSLFFFYSYLISGMMMLFFLSFAVISSLLGLSMMISNISVYGNDLSIY